LPAGDGSCEPPPVPGSPSTWTGPALGQAPPISADAAALVGFHSQYDTIPADPNEPEILRLRGISNSDEDVHALISRTTRKDYPTWIGISLSCRDAVGEDYHKIQFWEENTDANQFSQHNTIGAYVSLLTRMKERGGIPTGMPTQFEGLSMITSRNGKEGRILFTLLDSFGSSLKDQPVKVEVEYQRGFTRIGMGDRYTLRMLVTELWALTQNRWGIYPGPAYQTRADGTACHRTFSTADEFHQDFLDDMLTPPEKVLSGTPRGSEIRNQLDRPRLLQYFAWAGQNIETGVAFSVEDHRVEYWLILPSSLIRKPITEIYRYTPVCYRKHGSINFRTAHLKSPIKL
jgi:hypothetical protein